MSAIKPRVKTAIRPATHVRPDRPYVPGIIYNGVVYCSGATGSDPSTKEIVEGGIKPQARRVFQNLELVAKAGGASLDSALKLTIFLTDIENHFEPMNEVFREFFADNPPARSTVGVTALARDGLLIEAEMIAAVIEDDD
jgi:2-iminobutanoate/2-iminopropanoate deaminase